MKLPVKMTINGQSYSHEVEPRLLLVHYIRETVGLTGLGHGRSGLPPALISRKFVTESIVGGDR